ncbi:hypothetical protein LO762_19170 [Actinocorallia sp. API 0066]|uniref:hypothetical protein n=1 Tax=Actinocorallia sp. API 0066 TaxID=2896846 RepID=UPI001E51483A|nr:hypothetical protein [Actinocorallia sp. API 0066]MCD0451303.1 hypothetical protein [Actinocorallia sp. API 0066]
MGRSRVGRRVRPLWRCTGRSYASRDYDPARYRLAPAEPFLTLAELARAADPEGADAWVPATGLVWDRREFLDQPWVGDWMADWDDGEYFCTMILTRYGDFIPADLAVLEAVAIDFQGIETVGHEASFVHESHVNAFAGVDDLHLALHALYRDQWIVPLTDGTLVAPRLILVPA